MAHETLFTWLAGGVARITLITPVGLSDDAKEGIPAFFARRARAWKLR